MKNITFYFDVISPYAYLAFEHMPQALQGISYSVDYHPVLFAGLLKHHGQLGPAEIAPKREWTYRQVDWLASQLGIDMKAPASHPFNPLPLLRLAVACSSHGFPNRRVVEKLFQHVWCSGADAQCDKRYQSLIDELKPKRDANSDAVKAQLKKLTEDAITSQVYGVPTFKVDEKLFFGLDALPMLAAYLQNHAWFQNDAWEAVAGIPIGTARKK